MKLQKISALNPLVGSAYLLLFIHCSAVEQTAVEIKEDTQQPVVFSEDPFADSQVEIVAKNNVQEIKETDLTSEAEASRLVEIDPAEVDLSVEEEALLQSELRLAALQAKILADELSKLSVVQIDGAIQTMGDNLRVDIISQNPFGDVIELRPPAKGLIFEFNWTIERWGALTGSDKVQRHRVFRYPDWFLLEPGEVFQEFTMLPLDVEGAPGAVWVMEIDARIRCESVSQGEKNLPIHKIDYNSVRFLVLPRGWEQFADSPFESLKQSLELNSEKADFHVMVCTALLPKAERSSAVQMLIDKLRTIEDPHRALSITQALNWLTREELGSLPHVWLEWADQYNL